MSKLSALSSLAGPINRNSGLIPAFLSITPSVTSMYEGEGSVVFTVNTFAIPNNTVAYYTVNQISGTIGTASFVSASLSGSFTVNNNTGSFTLVAASEDGNTTDDIFTVDVRSTSISGPILLTSPQIKIVDLSVYNSATLTYNNGFGGAVLTYSIAATSTAAGNKTTATFQGTTITGNGGAVGQAPGVTAAGGTFSGGDGGYAGGTGMFGINWVGTGGRAGGSGPAGGGGAPGGNNGGGTPGQYAGGYIGTTSSATTDSRLNGLLSFITLMGWSFNMSGPATEPSTVGYAATGSPGNYFGGGGGGYAATQNLTASNTAYQRAYGGPGGMGGGGGGAGVSSVTNYLGAYTYASQAGGAGGAGVVVVQYDDTNNGAWITTGTSRTIPAGVKKVKVWAMGGGGGGKASTVAGTTPNGGACGGGGGGGGTAWKTWTYTGSAPVKPPL